MGINRTSGSASNKRRRNRQREQMSNMISLDTYSTCIINYERSTSNVTVKTNRYHIQAHVWMTLSNLPCSWAWRPSLSATWRRSRAVLGAWKRWGPWGVGREGYRRHALAREPRPTRVTWKGLCRRPEIERSGPRCSDTKPGSRSAQVPDTHLRG